MWSLVAGADTHFEGFSWLDGSDPTLGQHSSMKESIARSIGEFDEPKRLLRAEPFDDPADRWTGRYFGAGLAEPGSGAKNTRL